MARLRQANVIPIAAVGSPPNDLTAVRAKPYGAKRPAMRKWTALIALAFAALLFASACGDGGEPARTPAPTATAAASPTPEPAPTPGEAPVVFTHGVASGDVTPESAILWTRTDRQATLSVEIALDADFQEIVLDQEVAASAESDFTVKVQVGSLQPQTLYFYRFRRGGSVSDAGSFRTPPIPGVSASVRFAYSGDSDGTQVNGERPFGDFLVLERARQDNLDFFIYLGDTIYSDSSLRGGLGPAASLDEYRELYKANREVRALRRLLAATAFYVNWDDHEVRNDFDGQTVEPNLLANGRRAFQEHMPIGEHAEDVGFFRVFRWGQDVELIILDERSFRSADAAAACTDPATGSADVVPTLPADLRTAFDLPPEPPPGCLDALNDPTRTMLGAAQKQLLKETLLRSDATFKFIINELAIMEFFALPYDRWEGYAAEREEILNFIRDNSIENVVFLTTDHHATMFNEVYISKFADPAPIAREFVVGPIATNTLADEIEDVIGPMAVSLFELLLETIVEMDCFQLDTFSYGLVEVDSSAGTAAIASKDQAGNTLCSAVVGP